MQQQVVADVHLANHRLDGGPLVGGINQRASEVLRVLSALSGTHGEHVTIAGDVFDTDCPTPQLISALVDTLRPGGPRKWGVIRGNHDATSDAPGDHALGLLRFTGMGVVDEPTDDGSVLYIPWRSGGAQEQLAWGVAAENRKSRSTIVTHCGVYDDRSPPYIRALKSAVHVEQAAEVARAAGASLFIAGDFHEHKIWDCGDVTVCVVGTLCPAGWDDSGMARGHVVTIDDEAGDIVSVSAIPGPRFIRATVDAHGKWEWIGMDMPGLGVYGGTKQAPYSIRIRATDFGAGVTADEVRFEFSRRSPSLSGAVKYAEVVVGQTATDVEPSGPPRAASMVEVIDAWMATPAGAMPEGVDPVRVRTKVVDLLTRESVRL